MFRLVERGGAGPACDADGVSLGAIPLLSRNANAQEGRRYVARPAGELGDILAVAYGRQNEDVVERCHRGLRRVATALEVGDLVLAGIEAVMLGLPELDASAMAKLANVADLEKGGVASRDEPRVPAGQPDGGQWTTGGGGSDAGSSRKPSSPSTHHPGKGQGVGTPRARQPRRPDASDRPASARLRTVPRQQPDAPEAVSTVVAVTNSVAGTLVDAANWLMQPATHVPVAPEIAAGEPGFPVGAALEETTDPNAFRDWRPVSHLEAGADAFTVVGDVAAAARLVAEGAEAAGDVMRFTSLSALRRYLGPAGEGYQWHHIVEQTPRNLQQFGAEAIHSTDNMVKVPTSIHIGKNSISALYSSKPDFTKGVTVRQWLSTQSFGAQRQFGIRILKSRGQWK